MDFIEVLAVPLIGFAIGPAAVIPLGVYLTHLAFIELISTFVHIQTRWSLASAQQARRQRQIEVQIIANGIIAQLQAEVPAREPILPTLSIEPSTPVRSTAILTSVGPISRTLSINIDDHTSHDETTTVGSPTHDLVLQSDESETLVPDSDQTSDSDGSGDQSSSEDETSAEDGSDLASLPDTNDRSVSDDETIMDNRQQHRATRSSTISARRSGSNPSDDFHSSMASLRLEAMRQSLESSHTLGLSPTTSRNPRNSSTGTLSNRSGPAYEYSMPVALQLLADSHDRCVGTTKKGVRCRNPINALSRLAIGMTIQALSVRTSLPTLRELEGLAEHALCNHWHGNIVKKPSYYQGRRIASEWLAEYQVNRRRSQAPSPRTPASTMRSFDFTGSNRSTPMSEIGSVFSRTSSRSSSGGSPSPSPMRRRC